jgi:hypothetical protein
MLNVTHKRLWTPFDCFKVFCWDSRLGRPLGIIGSAGIVGFPGGHPTDGHTGVFQPRIELLGNVLGDIFRRRILVPKGRDVIQKPVVQLFEDFFDLSLEHLEIDDQPGVVDFSAHHIDLNFPVVTM